ncbi:hypothetical protein FMM68_03900 [Lachnospiraceae bacterium MD329]|nr:hypothetical protein [Lachnospiraceae bacterium MD329]
MIYDVNSGGIHTVRVTLQNEDFIGHFTRKIKGNVHGRDILDFDFESDDIESVSSDCSIKYDEDDNSFSVILKNNKGVELLLDGMDAEEMNDMIVGLEIIDFVPESEVDNE